MKKFILCVIFCSAVILVIASSSFSMTPEEIKILGQMEKGTYTNDTLGLKVYFDPEKWNLLTDEDIASYRKITLPFSSDVGALEKVIKYNFPVFMVIQKKYGILNVNLTLMDVGKIGEFLAKQQPETYIDGFLWGLSGKISNSMQNMELDEFSVDVSETSSFLNAKRPCILAKSKYKGVPMYQKSVALVSGRYVYQITVTTLYLDKTDDVLEMFSKY